MRRLWVSISGYEDGPGLRRACQSVRAIWPDPDRAPIVYSDGAYQKFPHDCPGSSPDVLTVAHEFASLVIEWPIPAPTEVLKRSSYLCGAPGDYVLILDTDETVEPHEPVSVERLDRPHYLLGLRTPKGASTAWVHRLFRVGKDLHHWGAHESVWTGHFQLKRNRAAILPAVSIVHHPQEDRARLEAKRAYYGTGIREDESEFRRKIGA